MDDLFGFLADRIAQGIKAAREADAEQRRIAEAIAAPLLPENRTPGTLGAPGASTASGRPTWRAASPGNARGPSPRTFAAPASRAESAPVAVVATPAYVAAPSERARTARPVRVALDDAFPTTLEATHGARPEPTALLRAFAGGNALLSALVLSEALAPPVSLRNEPPHRP